MEVYYGEVKDFTSGEWSGPREVDLGLTVKWATCNVGAYNIWSKGGYYAWGETEAKKDYSYSTYKWCRGSYNTLTKYNNISVCGEVDNELTLYPEDDVAQVKWGGNWRMPTLSEQDDLRNKCTWEWFDNGNSEFNGVAGYKVTSNVTGYTDRFIFLPAAEDIYDTDFYHVGWGLYWSSSVNWNNPYLAWVIYFNSSEVGANCLSGRGSGCSVRPVCP